MNDRKQQVKDILAQLVGDDDEMVTMHYYLRTAEEDDQLGVDDGFPVQFVHPLYHVAWQYDGYEDWRDAHLEWTRFIHEKELTGDEARDYFDEMIQWCKDTIKGEWNTFNGTHWAFRDPQDAMLFKLRWGGVDPSTPDEEDEDEEDEDTEE